MFLFPAVLTNLWFFEVSANLIRQVSPMPAAIPPKAPTKTQILANIAEETELTKKDVAAVLDALAVEIEKSLQKGGPGQFAIPGLCKIVLKDVPAKPKRKGRNPANGEEIWLNPKPASKKLTIRPLKGLKEMI
ncbi:nucleoid DNA-binding protein [Neorhodopirellula lusitana]|uniref:Viral histone-like protein n=2 Tax=Neorhodopirellula lusitana TaxID=445327 RepID=A0ABY1PNL8_9BACT|nr:nucleoid DNA-binding protein [Neorhodopirellula lusitana]